jgi:hypothetical protein
MGFGMRRLQFDQYEFEHPNAEETLELWIAAKGIHPFSDINSFVKAIEDLARLKVLPPAIPFSDRYGLSTLRLYLTKFAGIEIPYQCDWPTYLLTQGDELDCDILLETPRSFIRYHWWSTA